MWGKIDFVPNLSPNLSDVGGRSCGAAADTARFLPYLATELSPTLGRPVK